MNTTYCVRCEVFLRIGQMEEFYENNWEKLVSELLDYIVRIDK